METVRNSEIDPKLRVFLMAVRRALLAICAAIEQYLSLEDKHRD